MSGGKEQKTVLKLLALWKGREKEWLTYKQIIQEARKYGVSERTAVRYLNSLVRERKLMKDERGYKKTYYRPDEAFLSELYPSFDFVRIQEELLGRRIEEIISLKFESAVVSAKETSARITKLVCEELDRISEKTTPSEDDLAEALYNVLNREKISDGDSNTLLSLVKQFFEAFEKPISNPYGTAGTIEPHLLINSMQDEIVAFFSAFMDLWSFVYRTPGAAFKAKEHLQKMWSSLNMQSI